jgi:hypothetical protein
MGVHTDLNQNWVVSALENTEIYIFSIRDRAFLIPSTTISFPRMKIFSITFDC